MDNKLSLQLNIIDKIFLVASSNVKINAYTNITQQTHKKYRIIKQAKLQTFKKILAHTRKDSSE